MKLLDTNIVIYSLGGEHPYRKSCQVIINQLEGHLQDYTVNIEMLQEVLNVFWNKRNIEVGIEAVNKLLAIFPSPIPVTGRELALAVRLMGQFRRLSPRDAIHAAVVTIHGLEGIVSTDMAFDQVTGLRRFDPRELIGNIVS